MKTIDLPLVQGKLSLAVIISLLLLSVPYTLIIGFISQTLPTWVSGLHQLSMYLLLFSLIWIQRSNLRDYHIDRFTLWIFILSGTVFRIGSFSIITILFWLAGLSFSFLYLKGYFQIEPQEKSGMWLIVSCIIGIALPLVLNIILSPFSAGQIKGQSNLWTGGVRLIIELSWVALFEEAIFRGFLWGYLAKSGWNGKKILFFQAALFWIAHAYFVTSNPFTFWVLVPSVAILLGWMAWRSKSVAPGMVMHALYNTIVSI